MIEFLINEKTLTANTLIIRGKASTNNLDKHGESITISPNAFNVAKKAFIEKGGKMLVDHGTDSTYRKKVVGRVINMEYSPKEYSIDSPKPLKMSLDAVCEITDKQLIDDILNNKKGAFSLSWVTNNWLVNEKTKQRIDTEIKINELTVTDSPANTQAVFTVVDDEALAKQYKVGKNVKIFDTIANVKTLYVDQNNKYFVDLEFTNEIINCKTACKVSVNDIRDIPNYIINVKSRAIKIPRYIIL